MSKEFFSVSNEKSREHDPEVLKTFEEVSTIAQIVGGDFGMKVEIGESGKGSFYNPHEVSITIDPEHLKNNPAEAKFVVAHEGGHRAISRSPLELGVPKDIVNQLYSKPGFGFIQNAIEDPADNNWFSKKHPGLKPYVKEVYDEQFQNENAVLSTPEVMEHAQRLGFMPKFAKFGSEVIRHWHQNRYSSSLDKDVLDVLKQTEGDVKESIATIPGPQGNETEVIKTAQKRFQINTEKVWTQVEKLLELDLTNAERNEAIRDLQEKIKEAMQSQNNQEQGDNSGNEQEDGESQEQGQSGQESGESQGSSSEANNDQSGSEQGTGEEGGEQSEAAPQSSSSSGSEGSALDSLAKELQDQGFSKEDLSDLIESLKNQQKNNKGSGRGQEQNPDDSLNEESETDQQKLQDNKELLDKLAEKLDKYIDSLPEKELDALKEQAKKNLEDFEDALNKEIESKLNEDKVKNHQETRQEQEVQERKANQQKETEKRKQEQEEKLEEMRKSLMTPYEKYRAEVSGQIDNLYYRLRKVLKPEDFGKEESGYSSGHKPDMVRVMQSDYDFNQKTKLWIREDEPEFRDYRFMSLIDMSGSMDGDPIKEVFKGFVVVGEALDRLEDYNSEKIKVHQGIKGFHDKVFHYKDFNRRFTDQLEKKLATIVDNADGSTDTYKGTIEALEDMQKDLGKTGNFLLTFTDGSPNHDSGKKLKELLKDNREERRKKRIRVGLMWLGNASSKDLKEMINEYGYDFGLVVETQKKKDQKDFAEKLGDVIEDIIENPQKY